MTSEEVIERRLKEAHKELNRIGEYRYALVNDVLDLAVSELKAIVLAERGDRDADVFLASSCRTSFASSRLEGALKSFERQGVA